MPNAGLFSRTDSIAMPAVTHLIAVQITNVGGAAGFIASNSDSSIVTNSLWKCTEDSAASGNWYTLTYNDVSWPSAVQEALNGGGAWSSTANTDDVSSSAYWIWTRKAHDHMTIYCRLALVDRSSI